MLDGGPSRKSQTVERRASMRLGSSRRHEDATQPIADSQQTVISAARSAQPSVQYRDSPRRLSVAAIVGVIVIILVLIAGFAWLGQAQQSGSAIPVETDKLQAVFMVGGQVYFGKLEVINASHVKLKEVFYVQSNTTTNAEGNNKDSQATNDEGGMQLIKLGEEVHGPEDAMIINRDQVLFYENLKPSGRVSQLIQNYKSGNR